MFGGFAITTMIEDTYNREELECPYCHHKQRDAWELGDGGEGCGETECGGCEREFRWSRMVSVSYKGSAMPEPNAIGEARADNATSPHGKTL